MKNILWFLKRNIFNFYFIILFILSLFWLFNKNGAHKTIFGNFMNNTTSIINGYYFNFKNFFYLNTINQKLIAENIQLKNMLKENFIFYDTNTYIGKIKIKKDSIEYLRKFKYYGANVVGNTFIFQQNYIILEKGSIHFLKPDMTVVDLDRNLVGLTVSVNENYTKVMSILNRQTKISAMLKKNKNTGNIEWDGVSPYYVILKNVSKSVKINIGDSVVTSNYSSNYPPNILIGTIVKVIPESSNNFYTFQVKLAADFTKLNLVYVIENLKLSIQNEVENSN